MKNVIISMLLVCISSAWVVANKYESAMTAAIEKLYNSNDAQSYLDAVSTFERIGNAENDKWLPFYYAGLGYIWTSHTTQDGMTVDKYLDQAQEMVDKADKLSPNNDEIITLQGYIYMMKVVVDPPNRGPQFGGIAMQEFGRACGLNESNPRALLLMGRMQLGTDQFMGNDPSQSCGLIMKAAQMFESQQPKSNIDPSWGKEMADMFVNECKAN